MSHRTPSQARAMLDLSTLVQPDLYSKSRCCVTHLPPPPLSPHTHTHATQVCARGLARKEPSSCWPPSCGSQCRVC